MSAVLMIKRNDKQTAIGNEVYGVKHGDPVDIIDDSDPVWNGKKVEEIISGKGNHEAFLPVQIDDKKLPFFKSILVPHNPGPKKQYRPRIKRLKIAQLATLSGIADLDDRMHTGESLPIINGTGLTGEHFDDATLLGNTIRFADIKAISAGSATIGATGTYATLVLGFADIANFTGSLTFTVISALPSNAAYDWTEDMGGFNFYLLNNYKHNSDPTRNTNLITIAHNQYLGLNRPAGIGNFYLCDLYTKRTVAAVSTGTPHYYSDIPSANVKGFYNNLLCDNNSVQGCIHRSSNGAGVLYIFNNTLLDGDFGILIDVADGNANSIYSNNNILNFARGIDLNFNTGLCANNVISNCAEDFRSIGGATGRNNYSSDATAADGNWVAGTGNQINQVMANGFQSLVNTDSNFLDIIAGGIFDGAGIANDAAIARTLCGRGRTVPGPNGTSVGVAEIITPTPSKVAIGVGINISM